MIFICSRWADHPNSPGTVWGDQTGPGLSSGNYGTGKVPGARRPVDGRGGPGTKVANRVQGLLGYNLSSRF